MGNILKLSLEILSHLAPYVVEKCQKTRDNLKLVSYLTTKLKKKIYPFILFIVLLTILRAVGYILIFLAKRFYLIYCIVGIEETRNSPDADKPT